MLRAKPTRGCRLFGIICAVGHAAASSSAWAACQSSDWPQWRGPRRDGVAANVQLPRDWLKEELRVRWRTPLGEGYATPIVSGTSVVAFGRDSANEVIESHDLAGGKLQWRTAYPAKFDPQDNKGVHGAGPRASPIVHDGRVFTFGVNEVLTCTDAESGAIRWTIDFPKRFRTAPPGYGAASSPMIEGRLLFVPAGNRIFAVDYRSGSVAWNCLLDSFYSSLIASDLSGERQLVAFSRYRLAGLGLDRGKILWSLRYPSLFGSNIATPVTWNDCVIVSTSSQGTRSVRIRLRNGHWSAEPVWQTRSLRAYLTSPIVYNGHLYALDEGGMLFCLNLETGRTVWSSGSFSDFGTLVLAGDQLLVLSGYGELTAVQATPDGYRELGQRQLAKSATWTHLVVTRDCLLVRDKRELTCFELPSGK